MELAEALSLVGDIYSGIAPPVGDGSGQYKKLSLNTYLGMGALLAKLKNPLTIDEALKFSFGEEAFELVYLLLGQKSGWQSVGGSEPQGTDDDFIFVPADAELTDPDDAEVELSDLIEEQDEPPDDVAGAQEDEYISEMERELAEMEEQQKLLPKEFPAPRTQTSFYGARHQPTMAATVCTVDENFKAGDILLTHHPRDRFITDITPSWPSHAGMAISEQWGVDANGGRIDGRAVAIVPMLGETTMGLEGGFFEGRPEGGLVYRYIGDGKISAERLDDIRCKAAKWAFEQTKKKYRFALKSSKIIDPADKQFVAKHFDEEGKATDANGEQHTYFDRTTQAEVGTDYHNIYCAELVWRGYRHAGVNIVDPKEFDLLANKKQAVPVIMIDNISKLKDLTTGQKRIFSGMKLLSANVARKITAGIMRKKVHNQFYFCAPYQLASSELTEVVARLDPGSDDLKHIEFNDFRGSNIHPYSLVQALLAENKEKISLEMKKEDRKAVSIERARNKTAEIETALDEYMRSGPGQDAVQSLMDDRRFNASRATRTVSAKKKKQLVQQYDQETRRFLETVNARQIPEEEVTEWSWENYKKKNNVTKLALSVHKPWAEAPDKQAIALRLGPGDDVAYNESMDFESPEPPFINSTDFVLTTETETHEDYDPSTIALEDIEGLDEEIDLDEFPGLEDELSSASSSDDTGGSDDGGGVDGYDGYDDDDDDWKDDFE